MQESVRVCMSANECVCVRTCMRMHMRLCPCVRDTYAHTCECVRIRASVCICVCAAACARVSVPQVHKRVWFFCVRLPHL